MNTKARILVKYFEENPEFFMDEVGRAHEHMLHMSRSNMYSHDFGTMKMLGVTKKVQLFLTEEGFPTENEHANEAASDLARKWEAAWYRGDFRNEPLHGTEEEDDMQNMPDPIGSGPEGGEEDQQHS